MYIFRGYRLKFPNNIVILSLKIDFVLANSEDPDEMTQQTVKTEDPNEMPHNGASLFAKVPIQGGLSRGFCLDTLYGCLNTLYGHSDQM